MIKSRRSKKKAKEEAEREAEREAASQKQETSSAVEKDQIDPVKKKGKFSSFWVRTIWTFLMLAGFILVLYLGHIAFAMLVSVLQMLVYRELIFVGWKEKDDLMAKKPSFRVLHWYFYGVYAFYQDTVYWIPFLEFVRNASPKALNGLYDAIIHFLQGYSNFIAFGGFILGFMYFIMSLKKGLYRLQFNYFFRVIITLFSVVRVAGLVISNIFDGLVWVLLPGLIISMNDAAAYVFGITMGKTPLIQISPKKTWEGFIGAFVATVISSYFFAMILSQNKHFICPQNFETGIWYTDCEISPVFKPKVYEIPSFIATIIGKSSFTTVPLYLHSIIFGIFGGLIAPFGGFFASGVKRWSGVKDFANVIPGHGGFSDRFDCHFMMGFFMYVYLRTFISLEDGVSKVLDAIAKLSPEERKLVVEGIKQRFR